MEMLCDKMKDYYINIISKRGKLLDFLDRYNLIGLRDASVGQLSEYVDMENGGNKEGGRMSKCINCRNNSLSYCKGEWLRECIVTMERMDEQAERECLHYRAKTNADKIRDMTDEELAVFLAKTRSDIDVLSACVIAYRGENVIKNFEWLKKKVVRK